ncbi:MAG: biopolymer transporter ExbD [Planctomycetota bacterium]|nr:MAG: biopolymer transporter ExbD [Planctomycetota bacterium]
MRTEYSLPRSRRRRPSQGDTEVAMTPMIDVIFLLLVFFLATSSFQTVEKLLPSGVSTQPPATGSDSTQPPPEPTEDAIEQVVVKLRWQGGAVTAELNGVPLASFDELLERLTAIRVAYADVPVVIDPDDDVPMQDVVRAYDWARQAGLVRVYLAARPAATR